MNDPIPPAVGERLLVERGDASLVLDVSAGPLVEPLLRAFPQVRRPVPREGVGTDGLPRVADLTVTADATGFALRSTRDEGEERFTDLAQALGGVEHALCLFLLSGERKSAHLHAAGALLPSGSTILAVGPTGAGKSTMSLAWSAAGLPLLGDDVVLVQERGAVRPFRRLPKVDERRLSALGLAVEPGLAPFTLDREARFDPTGLGGWAEGEARATLIAFLHRRTRGKTQVEKVPVGASLRCLMASLHGSGIPPSSAFTLLADLVAGAASVEIRYADVAEAAAALVERAR